MAKKPTPSSTSARQEKIRAAQQAQGGAANKIVVATVVVIVAIIAVVGGVVFLQQSEKDDVTGGGNALPPGVSALGAGFPAFSDVTAQPNAPVVDVYSDFQCPACAAFEKALGGTITGLAQEGRIRLVYHVKNFLDDNLGNDGSTRAANAAFCAADAGRFQEFYELVFPGQPTTEGEGFTDERLRGFAESAGVTGEALTTWQACVDAGKYTDYVDSVEAQSFEDGVRGTPTVRIDGEIVELSAIGSPELFTAAVEAASQ